MPNYYIVCCFLNDFSHLYNKNIHNELISVIEINIVKNMAIICIVLFYNGFNYILLT